MENLDLQTGINFYKTGEYDKGLSIFAKLINQKFQNFKIYYYQGNCLFEKKQYKLAIDSYTQANYLDNNYEEQLQFKIGECKRNLQMYDEAIICYDFVIKLKGNGVKSGLYAKSQTLFEAGSYTEAIKTLKEYKKCLNTESKYQADIELALCYLKINKYLKVYSTLHRIINENIKMNDHWARIYYSLAKACKLMCLYQEALKNFDLMKNKINDIDLGGFLYYKYYLSGDLDSVINIGENNFKNSEGFPSNQKEEMLCIYVGNAYYFKNQNIEKVTEWHSKYKNTNGLNFEYQFEMAKYHLFKNDSFTAGKYLEVFKSNKQGQMFIPGQMLLAIYYSQTNQLEKKESVIQCIKDHKLYGKIITQYNDHMDKLKATNLKLSTETNKKETKIGEGGFGSIFLREDEKGNFIIVKKIILADLGIDKEKRAKIKDSLNNEIKVFATLEHPNIVRYGGFYEDTELYLEYCSGKDLASYLSKKTSFNFICYVIHQIAKGLKYLHEKNIIHGDMKTKNILLSKEYKFNTVEKEENYPIIKICDFGLARCIEMGIKGINGMTIPYAAPELFEKSDTTKESDVYAFGVIINELITKQSPFKSEKQNVIISRVKQNLRPDEDESNLESEWFDTKGEKIRQIMKKCWAQNPNQRMKMEEVCYELNQLNNTSQISLI